MNRLTRGCQVQILIIINILKLFIYIINCFFESCDLSLNLNFTTLIMDYASCSVINNLHNEENVNNYATYIVILLLY